jgi:formylglycine-generating enzyme required for sulfatase activity
VVGTSEDVTPDGIYDLGGNVSEWVETAFGPHDFKHIRGGHFEDSIVMLGSSRRFRGHRSEVYRQLGFRCAQSADAHSNP